MHGTRALVRRPGPRLADGEITHLDRVPVDPDLALEQWRAYVAALRDAGWETLEVDPADDCPDAVFIEDPVVVYGDLAVIARSGAPSRREEPVAVESALRDLGYRIARIDEPGTLDGGDVLKHDGTAYVGVGGRTNGVGIQQLAGHLRGFGVRVQAVPGLARAPSQERLHGPAGRHRHRLGAGRRRRRRRSRAFRPSLEEPGSHVVLLGGNRLLLAASAVRDAEALAAEGYDVRTVDISEFEKMEGCVTCLSVRLRG